MNNKEQLKQEANDKKMMVKYELDGREIKLSPSVVQKWLVSGDAKITEAEYKAFTELCVVRKLNPFLKEAYIIKYSPNDPAQLVVGKDAIEKRAVLHPQYDGKESGIIVIDPEEPKKPIYRDGSFMLPGEKIVGGWAKVYRKDWKHPSYESVTFDESAQKKKDGTLNRTWTKQPATMIEKVAKVRAYRAAFVEELGGMYDSDEINFDTPQIQEPEEPNFTQEDITEAEIVEDIKKEFIQGDYEQVDINDL